MDVETVEGFSDIVVVTRKPTKSKFACRNCEALLPRSFQYCGHCGAENSNFDVSNDSMIPHFFAESFCLQGHPKGEFLSSGYLVQMNVWNTNFCPHCGQDLHPVRIQ